MPSRPNLQASRSAALAGALLSRLNRVVPLDLGAINIMAGLRAAFACALPVLLGELTGNTHLSWIAIAAFWGCLADTGGAWSDRLVAMGGFTAIATVGCFIGTLVDPHAGLAVAFTFVWCFLCSLARVYGNAASVVGLLLNSAILVTLGVPAAGLDEALRLGGLTIAGGLWAMLLALVLWRLQPYGPARKAVARCWLAAGEYAAALSQLHRGDAGDSAQWNDLTSARRRATREAVESARDIVVATRRSRAGITTQGQRLLALLADADQVYAALIGLNELLEAASATASDSGVRRAVRVVLGRLAGRAEALAQTMQGETPRAQPDLKPIVDKLRTRIAASTMPIPPSCCTRYRAGSTPLSKIWGNRKHGKPISPRWSSRRWRGGCAYPRSSAPCAPICTSAPSPSAMHCASPSPPRSRCWQRACSTSNAVTGSASPPSWCCSPTWWKPGAAPSTASPAACSAV